MPNPLKVVCAAALTSVMAGCHHSGNTSTSDAAQDEFVQALPQIRSALPNTKQVPIRASPMTS
jgi:hypothetical protein